MSDEPSRRAFLRLTQPDRSATERMASRVRATLRTDPSLRESAARATTASPSSLVRMRSRLRRAEPRRRVRWLALAAPVVLASAAIAVGGWWFAADRTQPVDLVLHGQGTVSGTREAPEIRWVDGTLAVRVTPHRGIHLGISTPEARVEVVGTQFTVERRAHATEVGVTEGRVRVVCAGEPERFLTAGQRHRCLPDDQGGLLARSVELDRDGAPAAERLESATLGVQRGTLADAATAELLAHQLRALTELGRTDEALVAAEAYLATGQSARRAQVLGFVAETRFDRDGCAAVAAVEAAVQAAPDEPVALLLATCLADGDPARAAELVRRAGPSATGAYRALADQLATRLGVRW